MSLEVESLSLKRAPEDLQSPQPTKKARTDEAALAMMELLAAAAAQSQAGINSSEEEEFLQDLVPMTKEEAKKKEAEALAMDEELSSSAQGELQQWRVLEKDARQHCPVKGCSQFYVRYRNLEQHIVAAHGSEHLKALEGPMEIDDSPKPFLCPAPSCGSRYVRKGDLKVHFLKKHKNMEGHFPELLRSKSTKAGKKHACPVPECNCGYMRYGDLKSHFIAHHKDRVFEFPELASEAEAPSVCKVPNCSIRCTNEAALDTHMRLFHPEVQHASAGKSQSNSKPLSGPTPIQKPAMQPLSMMMNPMMAQHLPYLVGQQGPSTMMAFANVMAPANPLSSANLASSFMQQMTNNPSLHSISFQPIPMSGLNKLPTMSPITKQQQTFSPLPSIQNLPILNNPELWNTFERPPLGFESNQPSSPGSTNPNTLPPSSSSSFSAPREMN